jgi:hypothetical protein
MLNILLFYLKRKRMGIFYFADRRINVSLSISPVVHESAFASLSVGRGEECLQKDRYCRQDIMTSFVDPGAPLIRFFLQLVSPVEMKHVLERAGHAPQGASLWTGWLRFSC